MLCKSEMRQFHFFFLIGDEAIMFLVLFEWVE